jgi:hypothetical protein
MGELPIRQPKEQTIDASDATPISTPESLRDALGADRDLTQSDIDPITSLLSAKRLFLTIGTKCAERALAKVESLKNIQNIKMPNLSFVKCMIE